MRGRHTGRWRSVNWDLVVGAGVINNQLEINRGAGLSADDRVLPDKKELVWNSH